jgi:hypothetical protein
VGGEKTDDGDQLFTSAGKDDESGNAAMSRKAIHRIRDPLRAGVSYVALTDYCGKVDREVRGHAYIVDA